MEWKIIVWKLWIFLFRKRTQTIRRHSFKPRLNPVFRVIFHGYFGDRPYGRNSK